MKRNNISVQIHKSITWRGRINYNNIKVGIIIDSCLIILENTWENMCSYYIGIICMDDWSNYLIDSYNQKEGEGEEYFGSNLLLMNWIVITITLINAYICAG